MCICINVNGKSVQSKGGYFEVSKIKHVKLFYTFWLAT